MFPKVAVIVLNWNGKRDTFKCLQSIKTIDYPNYEIIVVDNASTDGSQQFLRENFPEIILIENKRNLGFGDGFNAGIREAIRRGGDYVLCLNNDVVVDRNILKELVQVGELSSKIGGLCPMEYYYNRPNRINYAGGIVRFPISKVFGHGEMDRGQYKKVMETWMLCGPAIMLKSEALFSIGLFDESYFYGPEDQDIALRLLRKGYTMVFVPKAKVWHKRRGATSGKITPLNVFFSIRNCLLFAKKNAGGLELTLFMAYFWVFYLPFTLLKYFILGGRRHIDAAIKGVIWHINKKKLPSDEEIIKILK